MSKFPLQAPAAPCAKQALEESSAALNQAVAIFGVIQNMVAHGFTIEEMSLLSLCEVGEKVCAAQAERAFDAAGEVSHG